MAEIYHPYGVGRVYEPGRLGEALAALAADRPALEAMRHRARQVAVERYNAEAQRPALYAAWGL
jgi:glycosyltransferase involved in cell wall biosynthesis